MARDADNRIITVGAPVALVLAAWLKLGVFNLPAETSVTRNWAPWSADAAAGAQVASLATLLVLAAPAALLAPRRRLAALLGLDLAVTLLVLANLLHFRFFGDVISVAALGAGPQLRALVPNVVALLRPADLLLFADLLVALPAWAWLRRRREVAPAASVSPARRRRQVAAALLGAGLLLCLVPARIVRQQWEAAFAYDYFRFMGVRAIGLLNYHAFEALRVGVRAWRRGPLTPDERARVEGYLAGRAAAAPPSPLFGAARGRDLIIVMVESVGEFAVDLTVEGTPVMPNLAAFARRSMRFGRIYSQAWEAHTADAEMLTLQSVMPLTSGGIQTRFPGNAFHGLPAVLAERGYGTMSAHAYTGELWKRRIIHPKLGFRRSYFQADYAPGLEVGLGLGDTEFVRQTLPRLAQERRPFLAFLVTLSSHWSYELPDSLHRVRPRPDGLAERPLGRYLNAVHYADSALGMLLDGLQRSGLMDSAVVVVFGDHPPSKFDDADLDGFLRRYAGLGARTPATEHRWRDLMTRVPVLIHLPGDTLAGRYDVAGGTIDLAPTLLSLLGVPPDAMVALGRDLTAGDGDIVVMRDGSFVRGDTLCGPQWVAGARGSCRVLSSGAAVDARALAAWQREADERLAVSDLIVFRDYLRHARRTRPGGAGQ